MSKQSSIAELLRQTEHYDKDERYMATSDINELLIRHAAANATATASNAAMPYSSNIIDQATEKQICSAILKLLDDASNDVQAIAVKTLGVLLKTVHEDQVIEIADRLGSLVFDKTKSELRDVYAIGLRTLVKEVQVGGDVVAHRLTNSLIQGIQQNSPSAIAAANLDNSGIAKAQDITLACLDVLTDLLPRFGALPHVTRQHEQLLKVILQQLASESQLVRKRTGNTIACLSAVISDQLLQRLMESLLSQIGQADGMAGDGDSSQRRRSKRIRSDETKTQSLSDDHDFKSSDTRALIHTVCGVSGMVGHRLGQEQIDRIIPILLKFCKPVNATAGDDDEIEDDEEAEDMDEAMDDDDEAVAMANELRESCFTGFQSFILRCPTQIQKHLSEIIHSALAYMRYDPNYSYGDENEDNEMDEDEEDDYDMDEDEDDYDDEDFSDDDDDSWKVRRSAIKTLAAVVNAFKHDITKLWTDEFGWKKNTEKVSVASALVKRFKEREENCRVDIIECFTCLLSNTISIAATGKVVLSSPDAMDTSGESSHVVVDFSKYVPSMVDACEKQLSAKKGGTRTKGAALALLSALCTAPGGIGGSTQISSICKHIKALLQSDSSDDANDGSSKSLKLDALHLVRVIITSSHHDPNEVAKALIEYLFEELCATVKEVWYKVTAESLRLLAEVSTLLHTTNMVNEKLANALYKAIEPRLSANDLDQEIKECALTASGSLIGTLHGNLSTDEKNKLLSLILLRLKNETTRLVAMKTISSIAESDSGSVDLSSILGNAVTELASLLRQSNRGVKYHSLQCLNVLIRNHGSNSGILSSDLLGGVLKELSSLVIDDDMHISNLSLQVSLAVIEVCPACSAVENLLPSLLTISTSTSINDTTLDSLLSVFEKLVQIGSVQFQELLKTLQSKLDANAPKQSIGNLGKCIATITSVASDAERSELVSTILSTLESDANVDQSVIQLALRTTGDLGQRVDMSTYDNAASRLLHIYLKSFDSQSEDIKNAAAYGLGNAAVKATAVLLPGLLSALEQSDQKKQYLLLSALREFIHCYHKNERNTFDPSCIEQIYPHLKMHCSTEEESVRTKVADCMGGLACLQPAILLPQLETLVSDSIGKAGVNDSALTCWTVATSIKFAIAGQCDTSILSPYMPIFLKLLGESDLNVRNAALLMVYSAVHHSPELIYSCMSEHVMPSLYEVAILKQIREVDLGPFKHKLDDALPLRKTALSIFATCIEKCPGEIDASSLIPVLIKALADVEDIQLQAHQMVIAMSTVYVEEVSLNIDKFVAPLEKTAKKNFKSKKGAELERANEWVKSALRAMQALSRVSGAMNNQAFNAFVERARNNPNLKGMLEDLATEM